MIYHALRWKAINTVLTLSAGFSLLGVTLRIQKATAATFPYQENPAIAVDPTQAIRSENGNVLTAQNAAILTNTSDQPAPNTIYTIPFIFVNVEGTPITLGWENDADAYINENYDGLGNRLSLAITNFARRIRLGHAADLTGQAPLPLVIPCDNSPSCPPPAPSPLPVAMQDADDEIPFFEVGSFAPGETKAIDAVLSFSYEDERTGVLPVLTTFSVLSETAHAQRQAIPEPGAIAGLLLTTASLTLTKKTTTKKKEA